MPKKILVAPLDWGLGHATRCITVIRQLQHHGYHVTVAAAGPVSTLLLQEFPGITMVHLPGYGVTYTAQKRWLPVKILLQAPKIAAAIWKEHRWLKKILRENHFDAVISDNRYGLSTKKVPCVFITHQLLIKAPYKWLQNVIQSINYGYIRRFTQCWVPDYATAPGMAGELSHPKQMPQIPISYIGPLCRFEALTAQQTIYNWLIILSGPEPQRSILEEKLLAIVPQLHGQIMLVRGKPGETTLPVMPANCKGVNHLTGSQLQQALAQSNIVVSRCGYTTVMEMMALQKKCVFIPTPGQTEQEYLAGQLAGAQWACCCTQDDDLLAVLQASQVFNYHLPVNSAQGNSPIITLLQNGLQA